MKKALPLTVLALLMLALVAMGWPPINGIMPVYPRITPDHPLP